MDLRVTPQVLVNQTLASVRRHFGRLGNLQQQASTGIRLLRASDGPSTTVAVLSNKAQTLRLETYLTNIAEARASLNVTVSALNEAGQILTGARQTALEASHATNDASSLESLAQQVDSLINRLLAVANTEHNGRFVFAGTATQVQPFSVQSSDTQGRPLSVRYGGSLERSAILVGRSLGVDVLYPGSHAFQRIDREATIFTGSTGAAPGTGTDSAVTQGTLVVRHTMTTYAAGSGVQAGTSSPSGDTIIGPAGAHRLTIIDTSGTGSSGTVSLDGGAAVAFTSGDTNLKVTAPHGDVVFIDTTNITPGFSSDVNITADGTLSVDNGASEIAIDFSANQVVTDSSTGAVTNVDSSQIRRAGTEHLEFTGTYDAFQILIALRDDLRNSRGLAAADQAESISARIAELDRVRTSVLDLVGEQSSSLQNLDALERRAQELKLETEKLTGELESADLSEVVLRVQEEQNLLQLTFAAAARIFDQSLLDFLR
jgi:flagellar hook-associated protein 3